MPNLYKKILKVISVVLFCFVFGSTAHAQHWCLPGSTWYYEADWLGLNGYEKYTYAGDTVVNNINCKKITTFFKHSTWSLSGGINEYFGRSYFTYEQNGVTYLYNDLFGENKFDTLFNFSAQIGDRWRVALVDTACTDSLYYMTVLDIGSQVINGMSLKWLKVKYGPIYYGSGNYFYTTFKIFERFGYKFDEVEDANCEGEGVVDYVHTTFRCYSDTTFGLYSANVNIPCDYINTDVPELQQNALKATIYPSPLSSSLTISNTRYSIQEINIYNPTGQLNYTLNNIDAHHSSIDLSFLEKGIYFIKIKYDNEGVSIQKIIKSN